MKISIINSLLIILFFLPIVILSQNLLIIGNEIGVLEITESWVEDKIELYNKDGSVWMSFDFNYEKEFRKNGIINYTMADIKKLFKWQDEFNPYEFKIDYQLLLFKCISNYDEKYAVIVNENINLVKYIKKSKLWILRNWKDHIINRVVSIGLDLEHFQIHQKPKEKSKTIDVDRNKMDPVIEPLGINDNWMKIRFWQDDKEYFGWIKWKKGKQMQISLWYLI